MSMTKREQPKISSFFIPKDTTKRSALTFVGNNEPDRKHKKNIPDDKEKIVKSRQTTLTSCKIALSGKRKSLGPSWISALNPELSKPYYTQLMKFLKMERTLHTVYPPEDQVFSWTHYCEISDIKVVILGQDPYHGAGQAHGLCFSVLKGTPPPPSLENIFKELKDDLKKDFEKPSHGDLTGWAKQGVLLLNAVLTVRATEANSHKDKGWETFTDAVIWWLNTNLSGVVFILWGAYAQKKGAKINAKKHLVLKGVHPSPLSAYRGFFGNKHFSKANAYLIKNGKSKIDWNDL